VYARRFAGKDGADFFGVIAKGDDVIELLVSEFISRFLPLSGNINADFPHCFDN